MSFKTYLKSKMRYLFGVAMIAALLSQLISPLLSVSADGPRFNFLTGDYQIIEGINTTKNESVWKNPVSGTAGDEFRGSVYYHNGMVDTTATNTKIKVNIPKNTTNKSAKITASISADNATTVTSTIVDGQLVGLDGLVVNLDKDAELEFIPGSAKWFPNASTNNPGVTPTPFPMGQTGNEIVSGNGVNIDGIQGCWQFAGFVTFGFKSKAKVVPAIAINKTVRNVSQSESSFAKETTAKVGEETEFKIVVTNTGNVALTDAILKDTLPAGLEFVSGSLRVVRDGQVTAILDADAAKLFGGGLTLQSLASDGKVEFLFKTKALNTLSAGDSVRNKAVVTVAGMTAQSFATVNIVAKNVIKNVIIVKSKSAYNDTKKAVAGTVSRNDFITYTLTTKNTGSDETNFVVSDNISEILKIADVVKISDSGVVTNGVITWPSVEIKGGQTVTNTFQIKIKNTALDGAVAKNIYGNEVTIIVNVPVLLPSLHMEKLVRNVTANDGPFVDANQAMAGDTLEYLITYSNTGDGPADKVRISDVLAANTQYVAGTTRISRNGGSEQTLIDGITGAGITLDSIPAKEIGFIKFRVVTSASLAAGENLINTAFVNNLSDTASTKIVAKPVAPVAATLPKTGATSAGSFMITMFMGIAVLFIKFRKLQGAEESMIINSLMA